MELLLIRHGESEADILNVHEGRADFELTEKGKKQAQLLAKKLFQEEKIDYIISSPLKRAKMTSEIIAEAFHLEVIDDPKVMEWDNGLLAGLSREEALIKFPLPLGGRKPHHQLANTESMIDFRARAESFLSILQETYSVEDRVCVVSHGGFINMLIQSLLKLPFGNGLSICCGDTAIHKFKVDENKCRVEYINRTEHLPKK